MTEFGQYYNIPEQVKGDEQVPVMPLVCPFMHRKVERHLILIT